MPEPMIADANQLVLCLGTTAADAETFADLRVEDATGNRYAYVHTPVPAAWLAEVTAPLSALGRVMVPFTPPSPTS